MAALMKDPTLQQSSSFVTFRDEGFPTMYPKNKTPAHVDVIEAGIIFSFVVLGLSLFFLLPAAKGLHKINVVIRIIVSIVIGAILASANFGMHWEVGHVKSPAPYKPGSHDEVHFDIGLNIGLRAINVTLRPDSKHELPESLKHEIIDYNEEFSWTWDQGRFGFGPYAGRIQREFREGQRVGLPLPILWIADYFTLDGEGFRFGRFYRIAGWYAHIAMWGALPAWLFSVILLHSAVHYGAIFTCLTGFLQLLAVILWVSIRNPHALFIPFETADLKTKFGSDLYLTLINGVFCMILGLSILILNYWFSEAIGTFFGIDSLAEYDEYHLTDEELKHEANQKKNDDNVEMSPIQQSEEPNENVGRQVPETRVVLKRRSTLGRHGQRSVRRAPFRRPPPPIPDEDEEPAYGNYNPNFPDQQYQEQDRQSNYGYQHR